MPIAIRFAWYLIAPGAARERYIEALRAADGRDYGPLFEFLEIR